MNKLLAALFFVVALDGCSPLLTSGTTTTQTTPQQAYLTAATQTAQLLDQVTQAADTLVKAGKLKGQDAQNTLAAVQAGQAGLQASNTLAATNPTGALSSLGLTTSALIATQTFLTSLGVAK